VWEWDWEWGINKNLENFELREKSGMREEKRKKKLKKILTLKIWNVKKVYLFFVHIFFPFFFFNAYDFRSVIKCNLFLISLKINLYEKKLLKKRNGFIGYF
jgi:hypothetical protein